MSTGRILAFGAVGLGAATIATLDNCNGPERPTPLVQRADDDLSLQPGILTDDNRFRDASLDIRIERNNNTRMVQVQIGDSLSSIAQGLRKEGLSITWQELAIANGLPAPYVIRAGQELVVPALQPTHQSYIVRNGDTLSGIAKKMREQGLSISWGDIAAANSIPGPEYAIHPGEELRIPLRSVGTVHSTLALERDDVGSLMKDHYILRDSFLEQVKQSEGYRDTAYFCVGNKCTIGWGHTTNVEPGTRITVAQAEQFLAQDLERARQLVATHIRVPLTHDQYEAVVDMAFNLGPQLFIDRTTGSPTNTVNAINAIRLNPDLLNTDPVAAVEEYELSLTNATSHIARWNRAGGAVQEGLVIRREHNVQMFSADARSYHEAQRDLEQLRSQAPIVLTE